MTAFIVTAEQRELVESILSPLDDMFPVSRLQEGPADDGAKWAAVSELGWLGAAVSEDLGGAGLGPVECALMAERFGRSLVSPSYVATVVAARLLESASPELSATLVSGSARAAFGFFNEASRLLIVDGCGAALLLVLGSDTLSIHEIEAGGTVLEGARTLWSTRLEAAPVGREILVSGDAAVTGFVQLLLAARASGIAAATRDASVEYAKLRKQFGQPIGAFQAVKHRCADMALQALAATDLVSFASIALAAGRNDASLLCATSVSIALQAALLNCAANIQIHGGMGFSAECVAHHYLKHARVLEAICGLRSAVRGRVLASQPSLRRVAAST